MKALENALNGPFGKQTWPTVDFKGTGRAVSVGIRRGISPTQVYEEVSTMARSPKRIARGRGEEAGLLDTNRTPPRGPLPRAPLKIEALGDRPDPNGKVPAGTGSAHTYGIIDPKKESSPGSLIRGRLPPSDLPRLSYSYSRPRASVRPEPLSSSIDPLAEKRSRRTLRVEMNDRQPRLVQVVYPRSAPAAESVFDVDLGVERGRSGSFGYEVQGKDQDLEREGDENEKRKLERDDESSQVTHLKQSLRLEREGKKRVEAELMSLQERYLDSVGRIAR